MPSQNHTPPSRSTTPAKPKFKHYGYFEGDKQFFLGVKLYDGARLIEKITVCGFSFNSHTERIGPIDHDGGVWLAKGLPEPGAFAMLNAPSLRRLLDWMKNQALRKRGKYWDRINYQSRTVEHDENGKAKPTGAYRWTPQEGDVPLAAVLVCLSREELEKLGGRERLEKLPSMLDLEPSLGEIDRDPDQVKDERAEWYD